MNDLPDPERGAASPAVTAELVTFLRRYFGARVPEPHDAEDLVQETLLRVHERPPYTGRPTGAGSSEGRERLDRWVARVAANLLVDHRRRARLPRDEASAEAAPAPGTDDGPPGEDAVVARWLRAMIDELPSTYRDALRLVELEGLTQREAAARLGLSVSGVKSRVQRGRARVRAMLLACCELEFDRRGGVVGWERRARRDACC